jgi:hypothetical protein
MKVKLLRDHLDQKKGDTIDVTPERANYFKLVGLVAGEGKSHSDVVEPKKPAPKKKQQLKKAKNEKRNR